MKHPILQLYYEKFYGDWNQLEQYILDTYGIKTHKDNNYPNLRLFKYSIDYKDINFYLDIVKESRGVIIDINNNTVVCNPFKKFGNYGEEYSDKIDWNSAVIEEKLDGSLIKLWFYKDMNKWLWSTNGTIDAYTRQPAMTYCMGDIIDLCENTNDIISTINSKTSEYDDYTFMFELVGKDNIHTVNNYDKNELILIGIRINSTGEEISPNVFQADYEPSIKIRKTYDFIKELDYLIEYLDMKDNNSKNDNVIEYEGFVVCDKNFNRIKIKSLKYVRLHHLTNGGNISINVLFPIIRDGNIDDIVGTFPIIKDKALKVHELYHFIKENIKYSLTLCQHHMHKSQKEFAIAIQWYQYKDLCFKFKKQDMSIEEFMKNISDDYYIKKIKELMK